MEQFDQGRAIMEHGCQASHGRSLRDEIAATNYIRDQNKMLTTNGLAESTHLTEMQAMLLDERTTMENAEVRPHNKVRQIEFNSQIECQEASRLEKAFEAHAESMKRENSRRAFVR